MDAQLVLPTLAEVVICSHGSYRAEGESQEKGAGADAYARLGPKQQLPPAIRRAPAWAVSTSRECWTE